MDSSSAAVNSTLVLDPLSLEGVASAYRYKVNLKNEALVGATFRFCDNLDVFSFSAVDKKRALKKEEWPVAGSLDVPNLWDVDIRLMAGDTEIRHCDGCASWKDKTRKPFLVLSPTGERVLQFLEHPFVLVIFRCCPKFHSCNKQFRLMITVTSSVTGESFSNGVNIFRKKMVPCKKRKTENQTSPVLENSIVPPIFQKSSKAPRGYMENVLPIFPYSNSIAPVVSPQMMYRLLYSGEEKTTAVPVQSNVVMSPVEGFSTIHSHLTAPILHPIKLEPQVSKPFWNLDAHPNSLPTKDQFGTIKGEITNDEQWLDSILNEFSSSLDVDPIPSTLDDISAMLDFPSRSFLEADALY